MSIDFILLGVFFIFSVFYLRLRGYSGLLINASIFMWIIGYFIGNIQLKTITINIVNLLAIIVLISIFFVIAKDEIKSILYTSATTTLVYILINYVFLDFNMYFTIIPFIIIAVVVNFANRLTFKSCVLSTMISVIFVEIFNAFFLISEIKYMALFQSELALCIIAIIASCFLICYLKNVIMRMKNEKSC